MTGSTNAAASDGEDGAWAAKIAASGSPGSYGIYVKPQPVGSAGAGSRYQGSVWVRSDTPGKTVCVNVKEVGATAQTRKNCVVATSSWQQLPAVTLTVQTSGDAVGFVVNQPSGVVAGNSFEVDNASLIEAGSQDLTAPTTPANLHMTQVTSSSVSLAWNASTDPDNGSSALTYRVSRNGTVVGTTPAGVTTFTDSGLSAQTQYSYTVVALDPAGNASQPSSSLQVTTAAADTTAPTAPTNVSATTSGTSSITVKWKASSDPDNTSSSLSYSIYRYGTQIGTVAGSAPLSFTDSGLQSGTSASYYVAANDPAGNLSPNSKTVWATTVSAPSTVADWQMDEPSGAPTMLDSSGNNNNGALTNVKAGVAGYSGTGYSFTPKAYVTVPDSASLDPGYRDITVTLHLKTSSLPSSGDFDLLRKGKTPGDVEYKIELLRTGQILCSFHGLVGSKFVGFGAQSSGASLANGQWHTITCARSNYKTVSLTVDGTHFTHTSSSLGTISPTPSLFIGANPVAGNDYYHGTLDDLSVQIG